jgi:hypothetical protein
MSLSYSKYVPHLFAFAVLGALPGFADAQKIRPFGYTDARVAPVSRTVARPAALNAARPVAPLLQRIVGGSFVQNGQYGYTAALLNNSYQQGCGGTLIDPKWVVTAAHCIPAGYAAHVRVGSTDRTSGGQVIRVVRRIMHPGWNGGPHDIGLLELETPAVGIAPAEVGSATPAQNSTLRLLGWGQTTSPFGGDTGSQFLKQIDTTVLHPNDCSAGWGPGDLCLSATTTATACKGDSGGPALLNGVLVGATSRSGRSDVNYCGRNVVYTNVTYYRSWIYSYVPQNMPQRAEHSGAWYNPATSGQGFVLDIAPQQNIVYAGWFTFPGTSTATAVHRWFTAYAPYTAGQTSSRMAVYRNTGGNFDAPPVTQGQAVGSARLTFQSCTSGRYDYEIDLDGIMRRGSIPLSRLGSSQYCDAGSTPNFSLSRDGISPALDGAWYDPNNAGQGFQFVFLPQNNNIAYLAWYTFDVNGQNAGANGQRWYTVQGNYTPGSATIISQPIYQITGGNFDAGPPASAMTQIGTATLSFSSCSTATLTYNIPGRPSRTISLHRLTGGGNCQP